MWCMKANKKRKPAAATELDKQKALAKTLGVKLRALQVHVNSGEGPPLDDVPAWLEFLASVGRQGTAPPDIRRETADARRRLVEAQAKKVERENLEATGKLVPVEDIESGLRSVMAEVFVVLERVFCSELPPVLVGLDEVAVREKCRREIDEAKGVLKARFDAMAEGKA